MDGVVSHCKWDWLLWLGLDMRLCVCSVGVVIFWLYNILLILNWVQRPNAGERRRHSQSNSINT